MSNPNANPNDEWAAYTPKQAEHDEWSQSQQNAPTQQFPAQSWEQEQWSQPAAEPVTPVPASQGSNGSNKTLYIIIAVLALALLAAIAAFAVRGLSGDSKEPVTSTMVETATRAPSGAADDQSNGEGAASASKPAFGESAANNPEVDNDKPRFGDRQDEKRREFGEGVSETSVTTDGFAKAVGADFRAYYAEHGETPTSLRSLSPRTGMYYTMSCAPTQGGFRCTGGNNASVFISER